MAEATTATVAEQAPDKGEVVRGVGQLRVPPPRAARLKKWLLFAVLFVVCGLFIFITLKARQRQQRKVEQTTVIRAGNGPATQQKQSLVDSLSRQGENVGTSHISDALTPRAVPAGRRSLTDESGQSIDGSMPNLRYAPAVGGGVGAGGQQPRVLTPEEITLEKEYELEQQALRAPMQANTSATLASSPSGESAVDPMTAETQALVKRLEQMGGGAGANSDVVSRIVDALNNRNQGGVNAGARAGLVPVAASDYDEQNKQGEKETFARRVQEKKDADYQAATRIPALGSYEIKAGWLIPAVLDGEMDSDLPGSVRAHVRENVFDSVTARYLLIPQGSRLIGEYSSRVGYGQKNVQAVFTRVIFPDGSNVDLESDPGVTGLGAAGLHDQVDEHWKRLMGGALLTSLFAAGIQVSQGQNSSILQTQSIGQQVAAGVGQQLGQVGTEITRRNLNIQPTLRIRPGYRFFINVEKDISFAAPYSPERPLSANK